MAGDKLEYCPHCSGELVKWSTPEATTWGGNLQLVCFNDECPYYRNGWKHMKDNYNTKASYRFRLDPETGAKGPLPVWSDDALRNLIVED